MDKITRRSTKVSLNGFNLQKEDDRLFLFRGDDQIYPLGGNINATEVCKQIIISKKCSEQ